MHFFNLLPDIGAVNNQSQFKSIASDSNHIYILGDMVTSQDSNGKNKKIEIQASIFDYQGNIINTNFLKDSLITKPYIGNNQPLFKLNDSINYYLILSDQSPVMMFASVFIVKLNLFTGQIIKTQYIEPPINEDMIFYDYTQGQVLNDTALFVFKCESPTFSENYIYEIDTALNVIKTIKIPKSSFRKDVYRWVIKNSDGLYDMIGDGFRIRNGKLTDSAYIFFIQIDSTGKQIKRNELKLTKNIFINSGQTYTISRNADYSYVISAMDWHPPYINGIPYFLHLSPQLDTIYRITKMYEYESLNSLSETFLTYMTKMKDGSGFVTCGSLSTSAFDKPDYAFLFKNSTDGDSLWTRKYQPLGWDSIRAWWMDFNQITCTPYNTLAICARVSDGIEGTIRGWILHLDKDGCLVPGCLTKVDDVSNEPRKETTFELYPNPVIGDMSFLLSRINCRNCKVILTDIKGRIFLERNFIAEKGVQYILEIPRNLINGVYCLKVNAGSNQFEQIVVLSRK